ncbi:hypothetical protein M378DRAFT_395786 [Amanita muscaria Koide BX008]|uniref:Protein kinase domain-containing protein n=1 Tax=Amanita muscaria (strain Koide BX008) TaxID=946122 RepID=A0A0C2STG1_AMAMK|nr:hypothetical protein M378DRAFT_395786 [Amanita muscaria Koide BX008]
MFTSFLQMLEIVRTIRYIHSMGVVLHSRVLKIEYFTLDSDFHAKILFTGYFAWWVREAVYDDELSLLVANCTYPSNISAFAELFHEVCFGDENTLKQYLLPSRVKEDSRQLIERCRALDWKSRPTMKDVVKEMETWKLT